MFAILFEPRTRSYNQPPLTTRPSPNGCLFHFPWPWFRKDGTLAATRLISLFTDAFVGDVPHHWSRVLPDTGAGNPAAATPDKGAEYVQIITEAIADIVVALSSARKGDLPSVCQAEESRTNWVERQLQNRLTDKAAAGR